MSGQFTRNQVAVVLPERRLDATIELILTHHCKALIADYRLSDYMSEVEFSGVDLVMEYRRRFDGFPCFVATSFAGEAIQESIDTNIIFPKSDFLRAKSGEPSESELPFFVRVRRKLEEYRSYEDATVAEFNELASRNERGELTPPQLERLIELDGIVERLCGKGVALPSHLKGRPLAVFGDLIGRAEALAKRVKRALEDES